jgi:hypothetical protein
MFNILATVALDDLRVAYEKSQPVRLQAWALGAIMTT